MLNERGYLGRGIALIKVNTTRIHNYRHPINSTNGCLEGMSRHRRSINRKAWNIAIINASNWLYQTSKMSQASSQNKSNGMLDRWAYILNGFLGNHANPLL